MPNLLKYRELQHLTQEELAEKSGLSVRTIQRIEAGAPPKGYTLKALAKALGIDAAQLSQKADADKGLPLDKGGSAHNGSGLLKIINLSSMPFTFLPPFNIIVPLVIVVCKKEKHPLARQILSIQVVWMVFALILFMLGTLIKKWFGLDNRIDTLTIFGSIVCNILIILRNAIEIGRSGKLSVRLKSNLF